MKRFREEPFIMEERIEMMIRKAVPQDLDALIALIVRRMAWMDEQGIKQWNTGDYLGIYPPAYFLLRITSGELFVAWDGQLCGMAALLEQDERWQDGLPAYYVHHLAADPRCPGTGAALLRFAEEKALQKGHGVVRLDAQRGNEALNAWYARQGYRYVGLMREGSYEGILREKRLIRNTSC